MTRTLPPVPVLPFLLLCFGLGAAGPARAETGTMQVAVMQLGARNIDAKLVQNFSDALATELGKQKGIEVRTDSELRMMMNFEASRQVLGCNGDECYSELGQMLEVDRLVSGNVAGLGEGYFVSLSLIDVKDGQVKSRTSFQVDKGDRALLASASTAVKVLLSLPATVILSGQVESGRVFLDGTLVGVMPMNALLRRENKVMNLRVEHVDYPSYEQALQIVPGEETQVRLKMMSYQERSARTSRRRWTGFGLSVLAAGIAGGGAALSLDGWDRKQGYDAVDPRSVTQAQLDDMAGNARWRIGAGSAGLGVGTALLGAGLYLLLHNPFSFKAPPPRAKAPVQMAKNGAQR